MKITKRQLRRLILREFKSLNENLGDPIADKAQALLDDGNYPYKVKEISTFVSVNPFDEFDSDVIKTLKKMGLWSGTVYYIETNDFKEAGNVRELISAVAPRALHTSSGGFLGRTVFFKGSKK